MSLLFMSFLFRLCLRRPYRCCLDVRPLPIFLYNVAISFIKILFQEKLDDLVRIFAAV